MKEEYTTVRISITNRDRLLSMKKKNINEALTQIISDLDTKTKSVKLR